MASSSIGNKMLSAFYEDSRFYDNNLRVITFVRWPYGADTACSVEKMAEAGFVSLATESEPTAVRCFFCCKELDSWHPDDDPRKEDTSHSLSCAFNNLTKDFSQLQVQEFLLLELERARFHIKRVERMLLKRFDEDAESGRRQMSRFIR
uniref:baculoviral IAP repeat-containing protein 5-like isoform X2 n=1 Tax=Myxine glutinosa TaxID=7769 RepID=UPI00358E229A